MRLQKAGNIRTGDETMRVKPLRHVERFRYKEVDRQVMKKVSVDKKSEEGGCTQLIAGKFGPSYNPVMQTDKR